jgi:LysR family transcriptional regulator, regulator of abg operon
VQELEKELGVVLFERRAKGVHLTPMGQVFLRRAKAVRSELTRAQDELDQLRGQTHGRLRVCLSTVAHLALLPNALEPFRQRYPDVRLEIIEALLPSVQQDLIDGTIDCYFGPLLPGTPRELTAEKLFDNKRVIVGRKGHPLADATSLRHLVDAEWVTTSLTLRAEEELGPLFAMHGLKPPKIVISGHSSLTFLLSVTHSDLLMMLPLQWTRSPLFRNVLQHIDVAENLAAPPIGMVTRTGLPLTPAADYFGDMMRRASLHMDTLLVA